MLPVPHYPPVPDGISPEEYCTQHEILMQFEQVTRLGFAVFECPKCATKRNVHVGMDKR